MRAQLHIMAYLLFASLTRETLRAIAKRELSLGVSYAKDAV